MTSVDTWVRLGVVGRPHGVRGALKLHLDNPDGGTVVAGLEIRCRQGERTRPFTVARWAGGVLTFVGVDDRTIAEGLVNSILEVRRADFAEEADEDEAFLIDLIGLPCVDAAGVVFGTIIAFSDNVAQVLAEVKTPAGPVVLVPFVPPIVVAIEDDRIVLAPPGGLFDEAEAIEAGSAQTADQQAAEIDGEDGEDGEDGADDVKSDPENDTRHND